MDSKDGHGLKLEKNGPTFSSLMLCLQKSPWQVMPDEMCLISFSFVSGVKALSYGFSTELT